jgi:hypothetical protein
MAGFLLKCLRLRCKMKWMKERDLLIAQTKAFVQSVTGKMPTADARDALRQVLIEPTAADKLAEVERTVETKPRKTKPIEIKPSEPNSIETNSIETVQITRPLPVRLGDFREEIRGRVAAFRAHQELFNRERNEYFNSVLTRLRASTDQTPKAPDDQPRKPPGMA